MTKNVKNFVQEKAPQMVNDIKTTGNKIVTSTGEKIGATPEDLMQRVARISKDKQVPLFKRNYS